MLPYRAQIPAREAKTAIRVSMDKLSRRYCSCRPVASRGIRPARRQPIAHVRIGWHFLTRRTYAGGVWRNLQAYPSVHLGSLDAHDTPPKSIRPIPLIPRRRLFPARSETRFYYRESRATIIFAPLLLSGHLPVVHSCRSPSNPPFPTAAALPGKQLGLAR